MALTIVGIGASAGGLEAIAELLGALPAATGMAYIVVQHLDPRHESLLSDISAEEDGDFRVRRALGRAGTARLAALYQDF
jgi:two-component system, chemotaxis family, CheB/CheR fusion protein